jgi:multicomponent Na+:H+ antiporter subunit D
LTLASFFKAFSSVFLGPPQERFKDVKEAPKPMLIPMVIMAAICIAIGLMPALGFNVAGPAEEAAVNAQNYIDQVLGGT